MDEGNVTQVQFCGIIEQVNHANSLRCSPFSARHEPAANSSYAFHDFNERCSQCLPS